VVPAVENTASAPGAAGRRRARTRAPPAPPGAAGTEQLPVVRRGRDRMGDQSPQPLALEVEQPVPRPPVPGDPLHGQGPKAVGLGRWGRGEEFGVGVVEVGSRSWEPSLCGGRRVRPRADQAHRVGQEHLLELVRRPRIVGQRRLQPHATADPVDPPGLPPAAAAGTRTPTAPPTPRPAPRRCRAAARAAWRPAAAAPRHPARPGTGRPCP
jgi:hypothetical protein